MGCRERNRKREKQEIIGYCHQRMSGVSHNFCVRLRCLMSSLASTCRCQLIVIVRGIRENSFTLYSVLKLLLLSGCCVEYLLELAQNGMFFLGSLF